LLPGSAGSPSGISSSGSTIGAIAAPPLIAWIALHFGWQYAFASRALFGLLWLPLWWFTYRAPEALPGVDRTASRVAGAAESAHGVGADCAAVFRRSGLVFLHLLAA
jgi:ACS family hexuronate transporter-like MFS transporter